MRDAILAVNVLDPATGSGHFAVDVVVYIAEWLLSLGLELPELDTTPDLSYWMRHVASACIYAVDINPLAVELAKLSIWLKTLAKDKPLSFLNHHIRVGNSLVGASLAEIEDLAAPRPKKSRRKISDKQAVLFGEEAFTLNVRNAVGQMTQIEAIQADDIRDVRRQEQMYDELRTKLQPYEQLAHVWTAREFGLNLNEGEWEAVYTLTLAGQQTPRVKEIITAAETLAQRRDMRFFHWDVAFPEVFFDANGQRRDNPGFDAIVGNPPYVRMENIQAIRPYLLSHYSVSSESADLLLYFFERGLMYLKDCHKLGLVTTSSFTKSSSAENFRQYINQTASFEAVVDFGAVQPFKGVDADSSIMISILRLAKQDDSFRTLLIEGREAPKSLIDEFEKNGFETLQETTNFDAWRFQPAKLTLLYKDLKAKLQTFQQVYGYTRSGIKPSRSQIFIIDEEKRQKLIKEHPSSQEIIKPILIGGNLRPWFQTNHEGYLILSKTGINLEEYPAIKSYLTQHQESLSQRSEVLDGNAKWYELRACDYYHEFDGQKIVWSDTANMPRFSLNEGSYLNNTAFMISVEKKWSLLALLQSRMTWFCVSQEATPRNVRAGLWRYRTVSEYVESLLIPELSATQESELATLAETITITARQRYQLHENVRSIISSDLGNGSPIGSGIDLYQWWSFADEAALSEDLAGRRSAGFHEIPLGKRAEWRKFLAEEKAKHADLTGKIITEETRLNEIVYAAFGLDAAEQALIESATKYPYGEV